MANTSNRRGQKDDQVKHQGVRKGSTATKKERGQKDKRNAVVPKSQSK